MQLRPSKGVRVDVRSSSRQRRGINSKTGDGESASEACRYVYEVLAAGRGGRVCRLTRDGAGYDGILGIA